MKAVFARLLTLLLLGLAAPAPAQGQPSAELRARAGEVVEILKGGGSPAAVFAPAFLAQVPEAQLRTIAASLATRHGAVAGLKSITPTSPTDAVIAIEYARAVVSVRLVIEPPPSARVVGLLVTGIATRDDTIDKLLAELAALPGTSALGVAEIGERSRWIARYRADAQMPIGSGFKLYVLAELARQVAAGERRWGDVVPLGARSLPSGVTQGWPESAPITLHTLATLMVSQSDNTATDTLIDSLGRERIGRLLIDSGHAGAAKTLPFLKTREFFALKASGNAALAERWANGDAAARTNLLATERLDPSMLEPGSLTTPRLIDSVEWFASPADMTRLLDMIRRGAEPQALAIMAVSPGLPPAAADWSYVGFKGGSEEGVVSLNYLLRDKSGRWFAVSGMWADPARGVDNTRFAELLARAAALIPR